MEHGASRCSFEEAMRTTAPPPPVLRPQMLELLRDMLERSTPAATVRIPRAACAKSKCGAAQGNRDFVFVEAAPSRLALTQRINPHLALLYQVRCISSRR